MVRLSLAGTLVGVVVFAGCTTPSDPADNVTPTPTPVPAVALVFQNQTDQPVDPNFYRSGSDLTAAALFADPANQYRNFSGKTTIPAKTSVNVSVPIDQAKTLGSNQAAFGDLLSWEGGKSLDQPVIRLGTDFTAAQTITFIFTRDANRIYHTTWTAR